MQSILPIYISYYLNGLEGLKVYIFTYLVSVFLPTMHYASVLFHFRATIFQDMSWLSALECQFENKGNILLNTSANNKISHCRASLLRQTMT